MLDILLEFARGVRSIGLFGGKFMEYLTKHIRQISVPEIGIDGHKQLLNSKVLIVGAGGLGTPIGVYLACSGVGTIGIIDHDIVEESNLGRQFLYMSEDIGKLKASLLTKKLQLYHPDVKAVPYNFKLDKNNADSIVNDYDLVINASDNFNARYLINKIAHLQAKTWIDTAVIRLSGQIAVFQPNKGCYKCLYPTAVDSSVSCSSEGIISPLCGMFGSWASLLGLNYLIGINSQYSNKNLLYRYDAKLHDFHKILWEKRVNCDICSSNQNAVNKANNPNKENESRILKENLSNFLTNNPNVIIIDLSNYGIPISKDVEIIKTSLEEFFSDGIDEPPFIAKYAGKNQSFICICEAGIKSKIAAKILGEEGEISFYVNGAFD